MIAPRSSSAVEPILEIQSSFDGGMRDRDHPSMLAKNQYALGYDIEVREAGLAKTRRGRTKKVDSPGANPQGSIYFEPTPNNGRIFQVNDGLFWEWLNSGGVYTRVGTTVLTNTSSPVSFSILNGILYILSGTDDNCWSYDGTTLTDEGNTNTDPPRGDLACSQAGRVCVSGVPSTPAITNARDYVFFSDIYDGHTYDRASNNKRTPTDGSEPVTAISTYRDEKILAFTRNSSHIYDITGATVSNFTRVTLDPKIGCIAPRSVVVVGEDAFFLSADRQLRTIKRTVFNVAYGVSIPVSYLVPNLMERINPLYASKCAGVYFDNYYLLSAPLDTAQKNSHVIVFDLLHQVETPAGLVPICVGAWRNIAANDWVITNFNGKQQLYYIDAVDGATRLMFDGDSDDGGTITVDLDLRAANWGTDRHDKTLHSGEIQLIDSFGTLTLSYAKDDNVFVTLGSFSVGTGSTLNLPFDLPANLSPGGVLKYVPHSYYRRGRSRAWQIRISHTGGQINIKQFALGAWIEGATTR